MTPKCGGMRSGNDAIYGSEATLRNSLRSFVPVCGVERLQAPGPVVASGLETGNQFGQLDDALAREQPVGVLDLPRWLARPVVEVDLREPVRPGSRPAARCPPGQTVKPDVGWLGDNRSRGKDRERTRSVEGGAPQVQLVRKTTGMHVGLAGAGRIGAFHARALARSPLVSTLTITDSDQARAAQVARDVGARVAGTPEALLEDGVEALAIASATPSHASLLHLAAEGHLPAFCEKPIALDLKTTDDVLRHVAQAGILLQIGFQRRFDAGYGAAREAVNSGAIGELYMVRVAGHDPAPPPEDYIAASGGIWRDLAIHDFDVVPWVTGQQIVEVFADGAVHQPMFARHGDVDVASATFRLSAGALGVISASRHDPLGYDIRMELFGSKDSVVVGLDGRTPLHSLEPGALPSAKPAWRDFMERFEPAYRAELDGFLHAASDGSPSLCSGQDARRALVVAMAAERSRVERRPVRVEEFA